MRHNLLKLSLQVFGTLSSIIVCIEILGFFVLGALVRQEAVPENLKGKIGPIPLFSYSISISEAVYLENENFAIATFHGIDKCRSIRLIDPKSKKNIRFTVYYTNSSLDYSVLKRIKTYDTHGNYSEVNRNLHVPVIPHDTYVSMITYPQNYDLSFPVRQTVALRSAPEDDHFFEIAGDLKKGMSGAPIFDQYGRLVGIFVRGSQTVFESFRGASTARLGIAVKFSAIKKDILEHNIQIGNLNDDYSYTRNELEYTPRLVCIKSLLP